MGGFRHVLMILAMAVVAAAVACSGDGQAPSSEDLAQDFSLVAYQGEDVLGGEETSFSSILGQGKPVVLNFWAGLCPPCRAEMPDLEEVHLEYGDRIVLLGLDVGPFAGLGSREDGRDLLRELGVSYPAGTTLDSEVVLDYQILSMPTTFFIKPNGEIMRKWSGLITRDTIVELVEQLIQESQA